jgi:pimeloyl-ACP methyl ester carboxylesterase
MARRRGKHDWLDFFALFFSHAHPDGIEPAGDCRFGHAQQWTERRGSRSRAGYIVGKNDRTVHPELERFVAKRMKATTHELESSHVPMLSKPNLVLDVIRAAANA